MAMNAKQAAELIRNGNFNDADELYDALNGQKEYGAEFARLLQHIETKVKLDMSLYTGLATSAKAGGGTECGNRSSGRKRSGFCRYPQTAGKSRTVSDRQRKR